MKTVQFAVEYAEKASRMELLVRIAWAIPSAMVLMALLLVAAVAACLQIGHILAYAKRHRFLHDWTYKFMAYGVKYGCYKNLLTDERSPIMPED